MSDEKAGMLPWDVAGPEKVRTHVAGGRTWRETWRQIGWVGQTGTPYALDDQAGTCAEPGGFAPLWVLAHADESEHDDAPHLADVILQHAATTDSSGYPACLQEDWDCGDARTWDDVAARSHAEHVALQAKPLSA